MSREELVHVALWGGNLSSVTSSSKDERGHSTHLKRRQRFTLAFIFIWGLLLAFSAIVARGPSFLGRDGFVLLFSMAVIASIYAASEAGKKAGINTTTAHLMFALGAVAYFLYFKFFIS